VDAKGWNDSAGLIEESTKPRGFALDGTLLQHGFATATDWIGAMTTYLEAHAPTTRCIATGEISASCCDEAARQHRRAGVCRTT
jgi:hypothetical protein